MNLVQELSGSPLAPTANLVTGLSAAEIFTRADAAGARDFLTDALGSTLALADSTGTLQTQYTYEPFGNTTPSGLPNGNTYQFTGRENDATGLYFHRARYYHPGLQRFISEDPLRLAASPNGYIYAGNNPVLLKDPMGLSPQWWENFKKWLHDKLVRPFTVPRGPTHYGLCPEGFHLVLTADSPWNPYVHPDRWNQWQDDTRKRCEADETPGTTRVLVCTTSPATFGGAVAACECCEEDKCKKSPK